MPKTTTNQFKINNSNDIGDALQSFLENVQKQDCQENATLAVDMINAFLGAKPEGFKEVFSKDFAKKIEAGQFGIWDIMPLVTQILQ